MSTTDTPGDTEEIREIFDRHDDPVLTTSEVGDALGVSRRTSLRKLTALEDAGVLTRKEVGARGAVWWLADDGEPEYMKGFGAADGTDFRDAVSTVREEFDEEFDERQNDLF